jgi:hypothetical protein
VALACSCTQLPHQVAPLPPPLAPGEHGYSPLQGDDAGLSAAAIRSLPILVVEDRRSGTGRSCPGAPGADTPPGCAPAGGLHAPELGCGSGAAADGAKAGGRAAPEPGCGSISGSDAEDLGGRPVGAHAGATRKLCAICLEEYQPGEKVRVLPCLHRCAGGWPLAAGCYGALPCFAASGREGGGAAGFTATPALECRGGEGQGLCGCVWGKGRERGGPVVGACLYHARMYPTRKPPPPLPPPAGST